MANPKGVRLSNRAEKTLETIESRYKERLKEAIRQLSMSPLLGKKLKGELEELRSYRVSSFRIVYRSTKEGLDIVYIDDRKDAYR